MADRQGRTNRAAALLLAAVCLPFLAACDVTMPSQLKTGQIRVTEDTKTEQLAASPVDRTAVERLAADMRRAAVGRPRVLVSYPAGQPGGETAAAVAAERYAKSFARAGVTVDTAVVSVDQVESGSRVVVSYRARVAKAPVDCGRISGYQGAESLAEMHDYDIGCESKSVISQMVADPSDLLGKGSAEGGYARRAGTVNDPYMSGKKNEKLQGENASQVGGSGG